MNITEINPWAIILAFAALQGYFLAVIILIKKRERKNESFLLSLLLILISLTLTETVFAMTGLLKKWPHLIFSTNSLFFLFGPILFLYIKSVIHGSIKLNYKTLVHFIPFLIIILMLLQFYSHPPEQKLNYMRELFSSGNISLRHLITWNIYVALLLLYVFLSFKTVKNFSEKLMLHESGRRVVYLDGLKQILILFSIYLVISIVTILGLTFGKIYVGEFDLLSTLILAFFIYWVAYKAIIQPDNLFVSDELNEISPAYTVENFKQDEKKINGIKFRPAALENNSQKYKENLLCLMKDQKPYLNTELKISDLAKELNIPTHHLSQLLNEEFQKNFYDFVNLYRVEEASNRLLDKNYNGYSILGIALDAGFNSKSSFNRIFKKHTGMTPSTYIRTHN